MANEITCSALLQYANAAVGIGAQVLSYSNYPVTITGKNFLSGTFNVPTTAGGTAIPISNLSSLGWMLLKNLDATNYVDILTAVSGTAFIRLQPGEFTLFRITPALTAPAALAHTSAISLQYLILEN